MNDKIYPSMVIRSQAEAIELLEKENQQLKEENTKLNIKLEDRAYEELKVVYEKAKEENQQLKERIEKAIKYIDYYVRIDDEHYDMLLQILDKAKESE